MFTPRELTDAYKQFKERGAQYLSAETGIRAATYQFGERVLLVYQESETDVVVRIHPSAWNRISRKKQGAECTLCAPEANRRSAACRVFSMGWCEAPRPS